MTSQLAITVWDLSPSGGENSYDHSIPFGGTTLPLFDKENTLHKGRQRCRLYRHRAADGFANSTTPAFPPPKRGTAEKDKYAGDKDAEELDRLERLFKKHEMAELPRVEWMDQLVYRHMEKRGLQASSRSLKASHRQRSRQSDTFLTLDGAEKGNNGDEKEEPLSQENDADDEVFMLFVELPRFDFPIVFSDHEYPPPPISSLQHMSSSQSGIIQNPPPVVFGPGINGTGSGDSPFGGRLVRIYDPEVGARDNPAESKHRRLVRSHRTGIMDRDLRPNAKVRDELNGIMSYSPTHILTPDEKDLVWKFRHHLTRDKRALTKFVKSVNWQDQSESKQAIQILSKWTEIEIDDALELLGPTFDNPAVRAYAVDRMRKADDDELLLYLLQLVQALKFEPIQTEIAEDITKDSSLARFLIARATNNFLLGNYFHWYLMVECDDKSEEQGAEYRKLFAKVEYDFMSELVKLPDGVETRNVLRRQAEMITVLSKISGEVKASRETIPRKVERVKQFLADPKNEIITIDPPLPLPLDPSVTVVGLYPEETSVFKSSLSPIKITFKTSNAKRYPIIFKTGDDLRQDQLVIQIITLMDQLLQKENLDLKLSPYKILATGATAGAVQFVRSVTLQSISTKYAKTPALTYLQANNPDNKAPLGVRKEAMETFVKSCAGYCVITYLLGVGDRHLDNLLLAPDGHFFHADFGYILGRDPKPFAPAMKLGREMIDGMGGFDSEYYSQFKQYCFTAYTALRKSSNLILNLFSLMVDANIPDIRLEPDKAVLKVKERFHLEMSEEDAIRHFGRLIEDSAGAFFPVVIDRLHGIVQHFRA